MFPLSKPFFERSLDMSKVITESIVFGCVHRFRIGRRVIGMKSNAFRERRLGYGRIHLNQHTIPTADVLITQLCKEFLRLFSLAIDSNTRGVAYSIRDVWKR